jgi:peptidyl-prolyl cis-trans isomerase C
MKLFQSSILMVSAVAVMTLSACNSGDNAKSGVAATVDGTAISENRVGILVKRNAAQGQPENPELRKAVIDQLAMQYLISKEAVKKGLDKKPEVSDLVDMTRQSILANAFVEDYMKNSTVSDEALNADYEKIKAQFTGNEYKARHILVAKKSEARAIITKLKSNPAAFESLAKAKTIDMGSKASGGDLGWFDTRSMVPEFGDAVTKLAKGGFTKEPVKSQFGYHVILLEDSRPKVVPSLDQIKPQLQQQIRQQDLKKLFDDMKAKAKIEITEATPAALPASEGKPAVQGE